MRGWKRWLVWPAGIAVIILGVLWLGTLVHEAGHALVGTAYGLRVTEMNVLGLNLYPRLRFHVQPGYFGYVLFEGAMPHRQAGQYMTMAGSLSTLAVAVLALAVFWVWPPRRTWPRLILTAFCFSWVDLLWHTSFALVGLRDRSFAETYSALVALGAAEWLAGTATIGISILLLVLTVLRWRQLVRRAPGAVRDRPAEQAITT
jgi:hypothetical protein